MKTLVIGAGGREHAIIKALRKSNSRENLYVYPGNAGLLNDAQPIDSSGLQKRNALQLCDQAKRNGIKLIVIGPESELVEGYADIFRENGFLVFGPSKMAAQLEGSKIYAKKFMDEFGIPTAKWKVVKSIEDVEKNHVQFTAPYVLKADGLAAGKGVFICKNKEELMRAAHSLFVEKIFNEAGANAILEQFTKGQELSLLAVTNGHEYQILPFCRDHKRLLENDQGPNTGGMGVIAPLELSQYLIEKLKTKVLDPTLKGFQARDYFYRGVVFIGVMLTEQGPSVLGYNVRFGDPETQTIMPLLDGDWTIVIKQVAEGQCPLLKWRTRAHVACVVLAAENYPQTPIKGAVIEGLDKVTDQQVQIIHAGTKLNEKNQIIVNGGRVLNVVATDSTLELALKKVYQAIDHIRWPGMQYRKDIGKH